MKLATASVVAELRELIVTAAPEPERATPVRSCDVDEPLDALIPFSSLIVLGVVVAVEDRYGVAVTREALERAGGDGATLRSLATMVVDLRRAGRSA